MQSYASTDDSLKSTQLCSNIDKYDVKNKFISIVLVNVLDTERVYLDILKEEFIQQLLICTYVRTHYLKEN